MTTRSRTPRSRTTLDNLRRSRPTACVALFTIVSSIVGPLVPTSAFAQTGTPTNPGNPGSSLGPSNTGIQEGQTDLGVPETGPAAAQQSNWSVDPSTGAFSTSIPFSLPQARGAVQPSLALVYSSSAGQGVGGLGWSLNLPSIERHNPSGLPQYQDPAPGAPIGTTSTGPDGGALVANGGPAEDWFTFGGKELVPICFIGSGASCSPNGQAKETMPSWATGGWHYYRLEVEDGSNLRFFWSPNHGTWVVQAPSGDTLELGVPQDNLADTGGTDTVPSASMAPGATCFGDSDCASGWTCTAVPGGGPGVCAPPPYPHVFRWNLVRQYDAQRVPGSSEPSNLIAYAWSKLAVTSPLGGSSGATSLISDLTDIYDTPPVGATHPIPAPYFAHHAHLTYNTSLGVNSTRADRATHGNLLTGVDVTSYPYLGSWNNGTREQVRRYVLTYAPAGHQIVLSQVNVDGWCATNDVHEGPTGLLPPEPASGKPACGVGPQGNAWPPATTFTYTAPSLIPTFTTLTPTLHARLPNPPSISDVNSDGLPDIVDTTIAANQTSSQTVWLNSASPATALNVWTSLPLTLSSPGAFKAQPSFMQPGHLGYASAGFLNDAHVNGLLFDPQWASNGLANSTTMGVNAVVYSPRTTATGFDWGVPITYNIASIFPGTRQNCTIFLGKPYCFGPSAYVASDKPFSTIDVNGDGLQDLLVSSNYGLVTQSTSSSYVTDLNVKFTTKDVTGIVTPFATPVAPVPATGADQPTVCLGGVAVGANPLLNGPANGYPPSTFGDINGDGLTDVIRLATDHLTVWYGHGDGVFGICSDGTTECACSQAAPVTISTTSLSQWNAAWSPVGNQVFSGAGYDPNLVAQFHDVDGDGFDDAIVPSSEGFDVYFIITRTGASSSLHVSALAAPPAGFGWSYVNQPAYQPVFTPWPVGTVPAADSAYMFADMDGSGVDDVVIASSTGQVGYVNVLGGERPGLLTNIRTISGVGAQAVVAGLTTTIVYADLPSLSRQAIAQSTPWSRQSPQPIHVATDVIVLDQTPGIPPPLLPLETKYSYANPVYDGRDRQFIGFSTVEAVNMGDQTAPSMHTKTTFYQGFCDDSMTTPIAYTCPKTIDYPNHALRGLPILTETYGDITSRDGNDMLGAALSTVHRSYVEQPIYAGMDGRSVHRTSVQTTDSYLYDNTSTVVRATPTTLADVSTVEAIQLQPAITFYVATPNQHALVQRVDTDAWGMSGDDVDYGFVNSSGNSIGGIVSTTAIVAPAPADTVDRWIWRPSSTTTSGTLAGGGADGTARTLSYSYDARGNLQSVASWLTGEQPMARSVATMPATDGGVPTPPGAPATASANNTYVTLAQYTMDPAGTGNVQRVEQQRTSRCKDVTYDPMYALVPSTVTTYVTGCGGAKLFSTMTGYAFGLGLVTNSSAPDGQTTAISYDPFGRVTAIQRPSLTAPGMLESGAPGVSISYGDTSTPRQIQTTVTDDVTNTSMTTWTVLDGYGRSILKVTPGDTSAGDTAPYILSGQTVRNTRGGIRSVFPPAPSSNWSALASNGTMSSLTPTGPSRTLRYDAFGRVLATTDLDGTQTLSRTYAASNYNEQDTNQILSGPTGSSVLVSGLGTSVFFDGHGRKIGDASTGNGGFIATEISLLPTGEPWALTRYGADATGTTYPLYQRWMSYDSLGRMVANVEPATSLNVAPVSVALGPPTPSASLQAWTYAYDDAGDLVATTDARGCGKNIAYDGAGRPLYEDYIGCTSSQATYTPPNAASGAGTEVFNSYDPGTGRLVDVYDQSAHTHYAYDNRSRLTSVQRNIVQANPTQPRSILAGYAPHTFEQDFLYDDLDRLIGQSTGEEAAFASLDGALVSVGTFTSTSALLMHYSQRGVVDSIGGSYGPLVRQATYTPDGLPNQTTWGDLASTQTSYAYDARRRLHERKTTRQPPSLWSSPVPPYTLPAVPPVATTQTVLEDDVYGYDLVGNVTSIADGRTVSEWPTTAQPVNRSSAYDQFDRLTSTSYAYPGSNIGASPTPAATSTESPLPLQSALSSNAPRIGVETSSYDPFGNRTATGDDANRFFDRSLGTIVNGIGTNQINTATLNEDVGSTLSTHFDAAGNLVRLEVNRDGVCESSLGCNQLFDYEWDEVGRLSRARRYDFLGGQLCKTIHGVTNCAPLALPTEFAYPSLPTAFGSTTGVTLSADVTFTYNASGERVIRTSSVPNGASTETTYTVDVFASLRLADTTFGQTDTTGDYDRSDETDQVSLVAGGTALGRVVYAPRDPLTSNISTPQAGQHVLLELADHLGSTTTVIDQATSELVERTTFSAFGRVESDYRPARWQGFREPFKFTGKEDDIALGITYFGARYYSPYLGTWISPDPLTIHGLGADLNPYAYVHGRTMNAVDPFGLDCSEGTCPTWSYAISPLSPGAAELLGNAVANFFSGFHPFGGGSPSQPAAPRNPGNSGRFGPPNPQGGGAWQYGSDGHAIPYPGGPPAPEASPPGPPSAVQVGAQAALVLTFRMLHPPGVQLGIVFPMAGSLELGLEEALGEAGGPGAFTYVAQYMSARAAIFQSQVTGLLPGVEYSVGGVDFDGFTNGVLLEAKGPGYAKLLDAPWANIRGDFLDQGLKQVAAANGTPVRWVFAEPEAASAASEVFQANNLNIDVATQAP